MAVPSIPLPWRNFIHGGFAERFGAIDFETANSGRSSACAVGLAIFEQGVLVERFSSLIRPPSSYFRTDFIAIHGIRWEDVAMQPTFAALWPELGRRLAGCRYLVAHNMAFDWGILLGTLAHYGMEDTPVRQLQRLCTVQLARQVWRQLHNHKLSTVCGHLAIPLQHHDAASDALAAGEIALRGVRAVHARLAEKAALMHTPLL